ncbi:MAG: S-layer homology domain-containing protein, partial [Clostridiales bacterium]|nr:S-layer homology domain-containing protein [Clostridiales bacterium]
MKKLLGIVLSVIMILSFPLAANSANASSFSDFPSNTWSSDALTVAVDNTLLYGTDGGKLDPKGQVTRAQMASIIVRAFGMKATTGNTSLGGYTDIDRNAWYAAEFAAAIEFGLFTGDGSGIMRPNAPITREEIAIVLQRAFDLPSVSYDLASRNDSSQISTGARDAISALMAAGYMTGYEDNTLKPKNPLSREELAFLLNKMVAQYITQPGEYTVNANGFVLVRCAGVTLTNSTVSKQVIVSNPGQYSFGVNGSVVLNSPGVTLTSSTVTGGVIVNKSGTYTLNVNGPVTLNTPSVTLTSSTVTGGVNVIKAGNYKFDLVGNVVVSVPSVVISSDSIIQGDVIITNGVTRSNVTVVDTSVKGNVIVSLVTPTPTPTTAPTSAPSAQYTPAPPGSGGGSGSGIKVPGGTGTTVTYTMQIDASSDATDSTISGTYASGSLYVAIADLLSEKGTNGNPLNALFELFVTDGSTNPTGLRQYVTTTPST